MKESLEIKEDKLEVSEFLKTICSVLRMHRAEEVKSENVRCPVTGKMFPIVDISVNGVGSALTSFVTAYGFRYVCLVPEEVRVVDVDSGQLIANVNTKTLTTTYITDYGKLRFGVVKE